MYRRIRSLVIKEFIHLLNDWWMPAFMLFGGALELLLVGWATSRPITNLPLMVWDQDQSPASRELITTLENSGTFALEAYVDNMDTIEEAMTRGKINAAVIIPHDYIDEISNPNGKPVLAVILNGAESVPATAALRTIEGVTRDLG
jgi:ABC-2 type transport system permease protein